MVHRRTRALSRSHIALAALAVVAATVSTLAIPGATPALADIQADIAAAKAQLQASRDQTEAVTEQYNAAQIELGKAKRTEASAQAAVDKAKTEAISARHALATYASSTYRSGGLGQLANLVSGDAQSYVDRAVSLEQVSRGQRNAILRARTVAKQQSDAELTASDTRKQAQRIIDRLAAQRASIRAGMSRQQSLLDTLVHRQQQIAAAARDAAARAAAVAQARALQAEAQAAAAATNVFSARSEAPTPSFAADGSGGTGTALEWARREMGKPYVYGAAGPDAFDCSGLTQYVFGKAGIALDHYTGSQWNAGRHVDRSELQPGDLVFFYSDLHHVGLYVGGGQMIDAPHSGASVRQEGVWWGDYVGAVRVTG